MKPIYSIGFLVLIFSIALLVVGGCQKDSDEDIMRAPPPTPTPVLRPNTTPMPTDVPTTPDWTTTEELPETLTCGQTYEVEVVTQDRPVNCRGYNFANVYNRAHNIAITRIYNTLGGVGSIKCPQACSPIHSWQITRSWSCLWGLATAQVRYGALCPNPGQVKPPDAPFVPPVPSLSSGSNYNPPNVPIPPGRSVDRIKENHIRPPVPTPVPTPRPTSAPPNFNAACPSNDVKYIQYFEQVTSCQNINFAPYIKRAEEWATMHHGMGFCTLPCTKQPFVIRDRRWSCAPGSGSAFLVDVDITYNLNCQSP